MRLIDADELDNLLYLEQSKLWSNDDKVWRKNKKYHSGLAIARKLLKDAPTIETDTNVVHKGKWIEIKKPPNFFRCSLCNYIPWLDDEFENNVPYYCPSCGARMECRNDN